MRCAACWRSTGAGACAASCTAFAGRGSTTGGFSDAATSCSAWVTFKRSAIAGLLPEIGIERAVLETDAPYLTPVPFRGKRNESAYVRYVCAKVAELCGTDERRVEEATERNVRAMFGDSIFC